MQAPEDNQQGNWTDAINSGELVDAMSNTTNAVFSKLESVGETAGDVLSSASDVVCEIGKTALEMVGEALGNL